MQCPNCFQQTEQGKFCTNCGALITQNESAVAEEANEVTAIVEQQESTQQNNDQPKQTNEAVEKLKESASNFGHFFLTLLKKPSDVDRANGNDLVSGIISIVIYSLLFALGYYLMVDSLLNTFGNIGGMFGGPSPQSLPFTDGFLWPFLKFTILFAVIISLTFVALKLTASEYSYQATVAKFGGYLIPFLLLLVAGSILTLINLYSIGIIVISVSVLGALLLIPTFILFDQPTLGIDRIYLLIVIYILNILAASLILQSISTSIINLMNPLGGIIGQ
ncbi:hypothetical protein LG329_12435 [Virgibacillus necropolis]|uniref:hypothetical protein n=1 Tax=Virgibacillus necropolis TaxID=163877 RepID=UPI0038503BF0